MFSDVSAGQRPKTFFAAGLFRPVSVVLGGSLAGVLAGGVLGSGCPGSVVLAGAAALGAPLAGACLLGGSLAVVLAGGEPGPGLGEEGDYRG